jgi:hypothetical protein
MRFTDIMARTNGFLVGFVLAAVNELILKAIGGEFGFGVVQRLCEFESLDDAVGVELRLMVDEDVEDSLGDGDLSHWKDDEDGLCKSTIDAACIR